MIEWQKTLLPMVTIKRIPPPELVRWIPPAADGWGNHNGSLPTLDKPDIAAKPVNEALARAIGRNR